MTIAVSLLGFIAFAAWLTAVVSLLQVVALAPKGKGLSVMMDMGWWKFAKVEALVGPAAVPPLKRYRLAFAAFFAVIFLAMVAIFAVTM